MCLEHISESLEILIHYPLLPPAPHPQPIKYFFGGGGGGYPQKIGEKEQMHWELYKFVPGPHFRVKIIKYWNLIF